MIPLQRCRECHTSQYGKGRPGRRFVGLVGLFIFVLAERLRLTHLPTFHQNSFALREKRSAWSPLDHASQREARHRHNGADEHPHDNTNAKSCPNQRRVQVE